MGNNCFIALGSSSFLLKDGITHLFLFLRLPREVPCINGTLGTPRKHSLDAGRHGLCRLGRRLWSQPPRFLQTRSFQGCQPGAPLQGGRHSLETSPTPSWERLVKRYAAVNSVWLFAVRRPARGQLQPEVSRVCLTPNSAKTRQCQGKGDCCG